MRHTIKINGHDCTGPDKDGEIELETDDSDYMWLTRKNLLDMLRMFDDREKELTPQIPLYTVYLHPAEKKKRK